MGLFDLFSGISMGTGMIKGIQSDMVQANTQERLCRLERGETGANVKTTVTPPQSTPSGELNTCNNNQSYQGNSDPFGNFKV